MRKTGRQKRTTRYRQARQRARPAWADRKKINAIYKLARQMRAEGAIVDVDHIVPLRGKYVCGLHVHYNLEIIDRQVNSKKNHHWWPDMPSQQLEFGAADPTHDFGFGCSALEGAAESDSP